MGYHFHGRRWVQDTAVELLQVAIATPQWMLEELLSSVDMRQ